MKMASARRSRSAYSRRHLAEDAHAEAGPGERMALDHLGGQAEGQAELAHFVLEQVAQRLEQLQAQFGRQAADVVVALDGHGLLGLAPPDSMTSGIDRALRQEGRALVAAVAGLEPRRLGLEHLDELAADDLALLLRVGDAGELAEELRRWRRRG